MTDDDIGIEVAAENARGQADHVLVRTQFGWNGHTYTGFNTYTAATGEDGHSSFSVRR